MSETIIAPSAGPTGSGTTPTGTGFVHVTAGVQDAAAKLVDTADVNADQITYAKIQNVSAASKLLGRGSAGGAGDVEEITLGTGLSMSGGTLSASGGGSFQGVMTADVTVNNSTTFVNATGLTFAIGSSATEMWQFRIQLLIQAASASSRWKMILTVPSGATFLWAPDAIGSLIYFTPAAVGAGANALFNSVSFSWGSAANLVNGMNIYGWVVGGGTAGDVQVQFAQNSLHASNNTFKKGSVIFAVKVIN